ncbi:MAG: hypothetical protein ABF289_03660 [Clostridiales bacterium]
MVDNNSKSNKSIVLKRNEIVYLAALTGNFQIIGIEVPINTMDQGFIKSEFKMVIDELKRKKIIRTGKVENIIINEIIYAIINACCIHDAYILVNNTQKYDKVLEHHYYVSKGFIVSMLNLGNDEEYEFNILNTIEEMKDLILKRTIMYDIDSEKTKNVKLPKKMLFQMKEELGKEVPDEDIAKKIEKYGYTIDDVSDIFDLLNKPDIYFSIFINKLFDDTLIGKNIVFIQNNKNIYQMKEVIDEEEMIFEFIPLKYKEAETSICEVLDNIKIKYK